MGRRYVVEYKTERKRRTGFVTFVTVVIILMGGLFYVYNNYEKTNPNSDYNHKIQEENAAEIYNNAVDLVAMGKFDTAYSLLSTAPEHTSYDSQIAAVKESCKDKLFAEVESQAINKAIQTDYESAFNLIENSEYGTAEQKADVLNRLKKIYYENEVASIDGLDAPVKEKFRKLKQVKNQYVSSDHSDQYNDLYRSIQSQYEDEITNEASGYTDRGDYEGALVFLDGEKELGQGIEAYNNLVKEIGDKYTEIVLSEVNNKYNSEGAAGVVAYLERCKSILNNNALDDEIKNWRSREKVVYLNTLETFSENYTNLNRNNCSNKETNYDNVYDYQIYPTWSHADGYAEYRLDDNYKKFRASLFVGKEASTYSADESFWKDVKVKILVDDEVKYCAQGIFSPKMEATDIVVDIENAKFIKVYFEKGSVWTATKCGEVVVVGLGNPCVGW